MTGLAITNRRDDVVLASASAARAAMVTAAGVPFEQARPVIDEAEVMASLRGEAATASVAAETLAELKARKVGRDRIGAYVIGADQVLDCSGEWFGKPANLTEARAQLVALRGRPHQLCTCVCVVRDGERLWHHTARADLAMREFSDAFVDAYLDEIGAEACESVGAYKLEGPGIQLFKVDE